MNPAITARRAQQNAALQSYAGRPPSRLTSVPSPTGGINTIDALDAMDPTDAVSMTNWFPDYGAVRVRSGTEQAYLNVGSGDVLTLAEYQASGNRKFLGASQTAIYDVAKTPGYSVSAVQFDGVNDYLQRGADLTGITDAKTGTYSAWIRIDGGDGTRRGLMCSLPNGASGIRISLNTDNTIRFEGFNSANTRILDMHSTTAYTASAKWLHVLASWDLSAASTNLYVNNVSDKTTVTATNDTIDYTRGDMFIGKDSNLFNGCMSEVWFTNTYIDLSSSGNRAKFIDSNGFPVSLGTHGATPTGSQPFVYQNGNYITFGTNMGQGGNFTVNGALTAASNTPTNAATSLLSGQTSGRWQTANFMTNMLWVNGQDTPQVFGGSTFTSWTGSCSGLTNASVIGCNVYRNRMYVWMVNDQNVFYGATQAIGGTYTKFPLGDVGNFGGYLVSMMTWTHDGGNGPDDYAVFIMSSGDVIIYSGDPASSFTLVGIFRIPPPLGIRSCIKFGGDILIQSKADYVLLSQIIAGLYNKPSKISGAIRDAASVDASNNGWQLLYWPEGGMVVGNVPASSTEFDQHVMNVYTGAWTTYADLPSRCWGLYNGNLYFGAGDGSVYQAETGTSDNGAAIQSDVQQAWGDAGFAGRKQVQSFRPSMTAEGTLTYESGIAYDYGVVNVTQTSSQASVGAAWDTSAWDVTDWSPEVQIKQSWNGAAGIGYKVAIRIRVNTQGQNVNWYRTDFLAVPAGAI